MTGRFRGVIGAMWSKSGLFRRIAKDYRKQKPGFVLVKSPGPRKAGTFAFTFSPTILATDQSDLKYDITRIFPTLNVRHSPRAGVSAERVSREFSLTTTERTKALREATRSSYPERSFPAKAQRRKEISEFLLGALAPWREKFFVTTGTRNELTSVSALKLFTNQFVSSTTTNFQQRHDNWLMLRSKNVSIAGETHVTPNRITTLTLNFAAPKASDTELIQQRIAHFVSVPALTYAKRQEAMSEKVVQALRELRTTEPEPKRVAAPVLPSIEQLTSQVKTQLERELRIERERRGL